MARRTGCIGRSRCLLCPIASDKETSNILNALERSEIAFNDLFALVMGHPLLLRLFIRGDVSLETLMILDMILGFMLRWDRQTNRSTVDCC